MKFSLPGALIAALMTLTLTGCMDDGSGPAAPSVTVMPAAFSFSATNSVTPGSVTMSPIVQVTGLTVTAAVSLDANANTGAFRICGDSACGTVVNDWRTATSSITNNQYLQVRLTSSSTEDTTASITIHVGVGTGTYIVTSKSFCELPFTQTDHYSVGQIATQNGWYTPTFGQPLYDEAVMNIGSAAQGGTNVWRLSNKVSNGGFGNQPLSPALTVSAGESTVRTVGGGDAMETVFWMRPVSQLADGSSIVISSSPDGGNRIDYFRIINNLDGAGGNQSLFIDTLNYQVSQTFVTHTTSFAVSRTAWTKVRIVNEFPDGGSNDVVKLYLDDKLVATTFTSWEDYYTATNGGNQPTLASNRKMFRVSQSPSSIDASFVDSAAQGFYFDNLCYRVYNRATPGQTIQSYRTGFES